MKFNLRALLEKKKKTPNNCSAWHFKGHVKCSRAPVECELRSKGSALTFSSPWGRWFPGCLPAQPTQCFRTLYEKIKKVWFGCFSKMWLRKNLALPKISHVHIIPQLFLSLMAAHMACMALHDSNQSSTESSVENKMKALQLGVMSATPFTSGKLWWNLMKDLKLQTFRKY